jgi:hypothetical protein
MRGFRHVVLEEELGAKRIADLQLGFSNWWRDSILETAHSCA